MIRGRRAGALLAAVTIALLVSDAHASATAGASPPVAAACRGFGAANVSRHR